MKNMPPELRNILFSLLAIACITIGTFVISEYLQYKDTQYFQTHKKELTHKEKTVDAAGNHGANFTYDNTPFTQAARTTQLLYFFLPVLLTMVLTARVVKHNPTRIGQQRGFLMYLFLCILTILIQQYNFLDPHIGWDERVFGAFFLGIHIITVCLVGLILNFVVYKKYNTRQHNTKY